MGLSAFKFLWWAQTRKITRNSDRIRPYSSLRSSKVIDLGVNRKPICDFLLVINSNFSRIQYRFQDTKARKWLILPTPPLFEGPLGEPLRILWWNYPRKTTGMGLLYGENCVILASAVFDWSTRVTDGQTDRRTDRQMELPRNIRAIAYMLWCVKMNEGLLWQLLCSWIDWRCSAMNSITVI